MNCEKAQTWIDAYVDGELDAPLRAEIEAHLDGCAACRTELQDAQRVTALSRSFEAVPPKGLRIRVLAVKDRKPTPMSRIKEQLTMKQRMGIRVGLATAVVAAVMAGAFVMIPREARANPAAIFKKMKKAAEDVKAMHSISIWDDPHSEGGKARIEIWTDGVDLYVDRMGHLEIIRNGKFHYGGKDIDYKHYVPDGTEIAVGPINPKFMTVSEQIKMLNRDGASPVDRGVDTYHGRTVQKISLLTSSGTERHTFWVDLGSDLPLRDVVDAWENGAWSAVGYTDYEFIDSLPAKLWENMPPEVSTHEPPKRTGK